MKETACMAILLAAVLVAACYIQPVEQDLFRERSGAAAGVKSEGSKAGASKAQERIPPAEEEDPDEIWPAC